jgi:aminoglycoside 3-N-acetyltransferase I
MLLNALIYMLSAIVSCGDGRGANSCKVRPGPFATGVEMAAAIPFLPTISSDSFASSHRGSSSMPTSIPATIHRIVSDDLALMEALLETFGEAFDDMESYGTNRPGPAYLRRLLGNDHFIALAAVKDGAVIGGLAAYELQKFEQERSEIYIYDLAVAAAHRRKGIATTLIEELGEIAASRGAYVIFVQADPGDDAAIALYTRLGSREDVLHFDIAVR